MCNTPCGIVQVVLHILAPAGYRGGPLNHNPAPAMSRKKKASTGSTPGTLLTRTRDMLNACPEDYLTINKATGCSPWWLSNFKRGLLPDPSVNRVQKLYEYLSGQPLQL